MLDDRTSNQKRKLSTLQQVRQQESVFSPQRVWIEQTSINVSLFSSNSKSGCVQVSNATIGLKHMSLQSHKTQFFCSTDRSGGAISN